MSAARQLLRDLIELLSEEESRQTLEFMQLLRHQGEGSLTVRRLIADPSFAVPAGPPGGLAPVEPLPPFPDDFGGQS